MYSWICALLHKWRMAITQNDIRGLWKAHDSVGHHKLVFQLVFFSLLFFFFSNWQIDPKPCTQINTCVCNCTLFHRNVDVCTLLPKKMNMGAGQRTYGLWWDFPANVLQFHTLFYCSSLFPTPGWKFQVYTGQHKVKISNTGTVQPNLSTSEEL